MHHNQNDYVQQSNQNEKDTKKHKTINSKSQGTFVHGLFHGSGTQISDIISLGCSVHMESSQKIVNFQLSSVLEQKCRSNLPSSDFHFHRRGDLGFLFSGITQTSPYTTQFSHYLSLSTQQYATQGLSLNRAKPLTITMLLPAITMLLIEKISLHLKQQDSKYDSHLLRSYN